MTRTSVSYSWTKSVSHWIINRCYNFKFQNNELRVEKSCIFHFKKYLDDWINTCRISRGFRCGRSTTFVVTQTQCDFRFAFANVQDALVESIVRINKPVERPRQSEEITRTLSNSMNFHIFNCWLTGKWHSCSFSDNRRGCWALCWELRTRRDRQFLGVRKRCCHLRLALK